MGFFRVLLLLVEPSPPVGIIGSEVMGMLSEVLGTLALVGSGMVMGSSKVGSTVISCG